MVEVSVCVGSSCHIRGSYQVLKTFTELIEQNQMKDKICLKASFCMGRCMNGIAVMVDDEPIDNVGFSNASQIFYEKILPKAQKA